MAYAKYVEEIARLYLSERGIAEPALPRLQMLLKNPKVLIVSPHPDDECLMGAYALRLQEECGAEVHVLPFSYGSNSARQAERKKEMQAAVNALGFHLIDRPIEEGICNAKDIVAALTAIQIDIVFSPHAEDGHPVHQKTFHATREALALAKPGVGRKRMWIHTEFWRDLAHANLFVPISTAHVVKIGQALQCHRGEVERNPYHLRLPAWYQDQVRKGSERVNGAGAPAVESVFGQTYFQLEA